MFFPKAEFCPFNSDEATEVFFNEALRKTASDNVGAKPETEQTPAINDKDQLMKKIQETSFAVVDLNLFLDTHPDCQQALDLYKKLCATLKSLKADYQNKFGPLYATESSDKAPFSWVSDENKWPWEL